MRFLEDNELIDVPFLARADVDRMRRTMNIVIFPRALSISPTSGEIICVVMPQKFQTDNILILWADEAQRFVTASEDGMSDYSTIDVIREPNATMVAAAQSTTSFVPPLGRIGRWRSGRTPVHYDLAFTIEKWHNRRMKPETIQIDKAGRVVLPKPVRQRFNLLPGDKLRLSADETGIKLEPADPGGKLVRKGSVLVFTGEFGEPVTSDMVEQMIAEDRERAVLDIGGKLRKK